QGAMPLGLALLPTCEDGEGVLAADEPHGPAAPEELAPRASGPRRSGVPRRWKPAQHTVPPVLRVGWRGPEAQYRVWRGPSLGSQGPPQDVRDLLRRARTGVVRRDPGPLRRRDHIPPLRPPRPA